MLWKKKAHRRKFTKGWGSGAERRKRHLSAKKGNTILILNVIISRHLELAVRPKLQVPFSEERKICFLFFQLQQICLLLVSWLRQMVWFAWSLLVEVSVNTVNMKLFFWGGFPYLISATRRVALLLLNLLEIDYLPK